MTLTIDEKAWNKIKARINDERVGKIVDKWLWIAGLDMEKDIVQNIVEKKAVNTGRLLQSWHVSKIAEHTVKVATNVEYAADVEYGTEPHEAPLDALVEWARLKFQLSDKEAEERGGAVWQAIKQRGTKPRHYLQDAVDKFNLNEYIGRIISDWEKNNV